MEYVGAITSAKRFFVVRYDRTDSPSLIEMFREDVEIRFNSVYRITRNLLLFKVEHGSNFLESIVAVRQPVYKIRVTYYLCKYIG